MSALSARIMACGGPDQTRYDTYPKETVVLLPQVNFAIGALDTHIIDMIRVGRNRRAGKYDRTYHLFEVCKTEDRIVDLDRACGGGYVSHGLLCGWLGRRRDGC